LIPEQLKKEVEELLRPLKHKVVEVGELDVELSSPRKPVHFLS